MAYWAMDWTGAKTQYAKYLIEIRIRENHLIKNKTIIHLSKILFTILFLLYVINKAGLFSETGRLEFFNLLMQASIPFIIISLIMSFLLNFSSAFKWYMLLVARRIKISLGRTFAYYQIGKFYNLILPTSMGGDIVRIYELSKFSGKKPETIASVFVERFTGMIILTLVSFIAVVINIKTYNIPLITGSLVFCIFVIVFIGWLVLDYRPLEWITNYLGRRTSIFEKVLLKITEIQKAVNEYQKDNASLWIAMVNSLIFYFLAVINVWVSALAFNQDVNFISILVAVPAILLIMNLPISIGGLGLMEFAYTFIFEVIGYTSALGLSTALLIRMKTILDGCAGGIVHLFFLKNENNTTISTKIRKIKHNEAKMEKI